MKRNKEYRIEKKEKIIKKRKKLLKAVGKDLLKSLEGQDNRLSIKHPFDCGNTKCGVCHPHKKWPSKFKDEHDLLNEIIKHDIAEELFYDK